MSYQRPGHPLTYFHGTTDAYVYGGEHGIIYDYGELESMSNESFCELIADFVRHELRHGADREEMTLRDGSTISVEGKGDMFFFRRVLRELARRTGCNGALRDEYRAPESPDLYLDDEEDGL